MVIPSHTVSTGHTARTANGGACLSARQPMPHRGAPRGGPSVVRPGPGSAAAHLSSGGFIDPGAQSTQAGQVLGQTFRSEDPSFVVLATVRHSNINSPAARKAGHAL